MKLDRMEGTLDRVLAHTAQVRELAEGLHVKTDALAMATLRARLEAVSMAQHYDETRRRTSLADAIEKLAELRHYYGALLASPTFCEGTENLLALLDTQERLVAACEGELFAEFLLGANAQAITERWRHQTAVFDAIAWRTPQSLYRLAEQADRNNGVFMVTQAEVRQARVMMLADVRKESTARLASLPAIATFLQERGVTGEDYIRSIAEQASTGAPLVVVDRRSESASLQPEG